MQLALTLNGTAATADLPEGATLLHALRGGFGLAGPRFGCGAGQCGACMVLLDGHPTQACAMPAEAAAGRAVITVEGLGTPAAPHPLQTAFLDAQAGQCGYCLSGILVSAAALLAATPRPDAAAIRAALEPHLCRCGSHNRILRAVAAAALAMEPAR